MDPLQLRCTLITLNNAVQLDYYYKINAIPIYLVRILVSSITLLSLLPIAVINSGKYIWRYNSLCSRNN